LRSSITSFALILICVLSVLPVFSAEPDGSIAGTVLDSTGAVISDARVMVVRNDSNVEQTTSTGGDGRFQMRLATGDYVFKVSHAGFTDVSVPLHISPSLADIHDFVLKVSGASQTVTVIESSSGAPTAIASATRTLIPLQDLPQTVNVIGQQQVKEQMMMSVGDVLRYVPGVSVHQGENNRDQIVVRANSSSADFFVDGVRDDVQYYRDLYNLEQVEVLKGPNAMIFGRGGGGGVINRVTKEAGFPALREITLNGGSYGSKRISTDFDQPFNNKLALRLNAMYENSDTFRKYVGLERSGFNPTLTFNPGSATTINVGYERFHDGRTADRGIPSYAGLPADEVRGEYFGNPDDSRVRALVNSGRVNIEHRIGGLLIHNQTLFADYDRGYQNYVPGAVNASKTLVALSAYNNATHRRNTFNQTDLSYAFGTGFLHHTIVGGTEFGRQQSDNFRNTGYFNNTASSVQVPFTSPTTAMPVTFRQSATDANNHIQTNIGAAYVQDQVEITHYLQVIGGVRFDDFGLRYHNNRNGAELTRVDRLVSPRAGIVLKPVMAVSIYGNYSVSYLPSAGDQFSSLTDITQQLEPEKFNNYEFGVKWSARRDLTFNTAVYRLDRTNTRAVDPSDPTRILQTGRTRADGFEIGVDGNIWRSWRLTGGYAYQDAFIASATAAARAGAVVAQVPKHSFSLWNHYQVVRRVGAGLGVIHRSDMFAAVDNAVTLPSYTRADAALYIKMTERTQLQANLENLTGARYYLNADGNNNISPGSPRAVRLALTARF
jgi:catecholate siderophore receptor